MFRSFSAYHASLFMLELSAGLDELGPAQYTLSIFSDKEVNRVYV